MTTPVTPTGTNWQQESQFYDQLHPRLLTMAKLINAMPERSLLDAGCSAGTLKKLLPADYQYFGCDITDLALPRLGASHFQQIDLNATQDLSFFEQRGIRLIHMGGFLEYMSKPQDVLRAFHRIVGVGGRLIMSMTNMECQRYQDPKTHHKDWLFKPKVEELRETLNSAGWQVEREIPFVGPSGWRGPFLRRLATWRGVDHPWTRQKAWLFITIARAV